MKALKTKHALSGLMAGLLLLAAGSAQAEIVSIPDGSLPESAFAQTGVGTHKLLAANFNVNNSPITISGTLDPSGTSNQLPLGKYNLGMTVGNVYFLFHPFYPGGAFRYDPVDLAISLVSPFQYTANIGMGFTPNDSPLDFSIVLSPGAAGFINFEVTIGQGANSFNLSATLVESVFGLDGQVSSFGVFHNGDGLGFGVLGYSDVMASIPDSDGDGLSDDEEVNGTKNPWTNGVFGVPPGDPTNPNEADSDFDDLDDLAEIEDHDTDPNNADTDGDGLTDGYEIALNPYVTSPTSADSDGDGINDKLELDCGTDPTQPDNISGLVEERLRNLADDIIGNIPATTGTDGCFNAPNNKSAKGRRSALSNKSHAAANKVAAGNLSGARDKLINDVREKADEWLNDAGMMMMDCDKDEVLAEIDCIIALLDAALAQ